MAFKPNYSQERRDRDRAKDQRKLEKQQRRDEATAKRKAAREEALASDGIKTVEE